MNKKIAIVAAALIGTAWYFFLAAKPINLATADLGRHLANGKWILSDPATFHKLITTNFYSATYPDFPFTNHHWATGLLFYAVHAVGGFVGLSLFNFGLQLAALALALWAAARRSGWIAAAAAGLIALPALSCRAEVRPENISYLFCTIYYVILSLQYNEARTDESAPFNEESPQRRTIYLLPALMLAWANLHIYFVFGFFILGCFLLQELFHRRPTARLWKVSALCFAASLVNPLGFRLLLEPFQIFQNYGYRIAENQSVLFFIRYGHAEAILLPYFVIAPFVVALAFAALRLKAKIPLSIALIAGVPLLMATLAIRNFPFFGILSIPFLAAAIGALGKAFPKAPAWLAGAVALTNVAYAAELSRLGTAPAGIGLVPGIENSAEFFRVHQLHGPIFNNFDIGGYLIYELFPDQRVFVDNRPEAYPASFFSDVYQPMQENEQSWKDESARYGFNAIYFFRLDMTPRAQEFLIRRVRDPEWVPVYADFATVIFLKNTPENQAVIQNFQLKRPTGG
jgi:hypothetical protein